MSYCTSQNHDPLSVILTAGISTCCLTPITPKSSAKFFSLENTASFLPPFHWKHSRVPLSPSQFLPHPLPSSPGSSLGSTPTQTVISAVTRCSPGRLSLSGAPQRGKTRAALSGNAPPYPIPLSCSSPFARPLGSIVRLLAQIFDSFCNSLFQFIHQLR